MKNKIESRYGKHSRKRSSSNSSPEIKSDRKYEGNNSKYKQRKHLERKSPSKRRESRSRSRSSDNESNNNNGGDEDGSVDRKNNSFKSERSLKIEHMYENIKIKEEPISDDEKNKSTNNNDKTKRKQYDNESRERRRRSRSRSRSRSKSLSYDRRPIKKEKFNDDYRRRPVKKEYAGDTDKEPRWGKHDDQSGSQDKKKPIANKAKPDFGLSGKLAEETNTYNGVVIKYSEPPEARKPRRRWRFYPFKGDEGLPTLYIHRQSAYLIGRDRKIADLPIDHPSCSKQHAVLQYRLVPFERTDGTRGKKICPYIIDLESANGTFVNNVKIDPKKYVELFEKDVLKFAFSSREYVLLHEHSKDSGEDDDM